MRKLFIFTAGALPCLKTRWQYHSLRSVTTQSLRHRVSAILLCLAQCVSAQQVNGTKALRIGEKVPNIALKSILNYKKNAGSLSEFRGKAVILDFWTLYCSACIHHFPQMNSLQKEYGKNLQIILVDCYSKDSKKQLANFVVKQQEKSPDFSLPIVQSDSILRSVFPIKSVPHYIWIDASGRIRAITSASEITSANVERLIAGLLLNLPLKEN